MSVRSYADIEMRIKRQRNHLMRCLARLFRGNLNRGIYILISRGACRMLVSDRI